MLKDYISYVNEAGVTNRTQARSISSIRSFFKYLAYDGVLETTLQNCWKHRKSDVNFPVSLL